MSRRIRAALAVALVILVSGCTAGAGPRATDTPAAMPRVLTEAELSRALLKVDDVGTGFVADTYPWDVKDDGPGCLRILNAITWFATPIYEEKAGITADSTVRFPAVFTAAATFGTDKDAALALPALRDKISTCKQIGSTDGNAQVRLRVTHDERRLPPKFDDQFNVSATGKVRVGDLTVPLSIRYSAVRIGNNVVLTAFMTATDQSVIHEADAVTLAAVRRLIAVAAGNPVPNSPPLGFKPYDPQALTAQDV